MCPIGLWEAWLLDSSILCRAVPPKGLLMSYKLSLNVRVYSISDYSVSSVFKHYNNFILAVRSNCEAKPNISRRQKGADVIQRSFSLSWQHVCNPPKKTEGNTNTVVTAKSLWHLCIISVIPWNYKLGLHWWSEGHTKRKRLCFEPLWLQSGKNHSQKTLTCSCNK